LKCILVFATAVFSISNSGPLAGARNGRLISSTPAELQINGELSTDLKGERVYGTWNRRWPKT
jgi:hypothetical protein